MAGNSNCENDPSETDQPDCLKFWWHVNKSGFPICEETWDKMWSYVTAVHPEGPKLASSIQNNPCTKKTPIPSVPYITQSCPPNEAMTRVQTYLQELQYNYTGTQFFDINKSRSTSRLMELARDMIHESLPIKCLEAVVLSLYLTVPVATLQRFPIGFKSIHNGKYHRHVVLGCYHSGLYGALGLSRRPSLMYKPLRFKLLSEIMEDYIRSYEECGHSVVRIKIGAPVVHNCHSCEQIHWKLGVVRVLDSEPVLVKKTIEKISKLMRTYIV